MPLPRVRWTMRWMMIVVAVVAVNFAVLRLADEQGSSLGVEMVEAFFLFSPPLSLLAVAAASVVVGLVKRGRAPGFSTGYLLIGGLASLLACLAVATQLLTFLYELLGERKILVDQFLMAGGYGELVLLVVFVFLQIAIALFGGALAARLKLTIVCERRAPEVPLSS